jgi:CRISPR-associated protein Cmr5
MKTRSQQYSEIVFNQVLNLKDKPYKKFYASLTHEFPLMVLRSGLSQAVAFVWAKAQPKKEEPTPSLEAQAKLIFLEHLIQLIKCHAATPKDFQVHIQTAKLAEYQRLTRQILAASVWYKRFADSLLKVGGTP